MIAFANAFASAVSAATLATVLTFLTAFLTLVLEQPCNAMDSTTKQVSRLDIDIIFDNLR